jgi:hypothetical protein
MGKKEGKGILKEANGTVYEGDFHKNEKVGQGKYIYKDKAYEGPFLGGKFHGTGTLRYGNGDLYEGEFVEGRKEGYGKLTLSKSRESFSYEGNFKGDKLEGEGVLTYANGDTFKGSFSDSKKHGDGVYENKLKQESYEGRWVMDVKNGRFIETKHKENVKIYGNFTDGERNGVFVHEDLSGNRIKEEEWVKGKLIYK